MISLRATIKAIEGNFCMSNLFQNHYFRQFIILKAGIEFEFENDKNLTASEDLIFRLQTKYNRKDNDKNKPFTGKSEPAKRSKIIQYRREKLIFRGCW